MTVGECQFYVTFHKMCAFSAESTAVTGRGVDSDNFSVDNGKTMKYDQYKE